MVLEVNTTVYIYYIITYIPLNSNLITISVIMREACLVCSYHTATSIILNSISCLIQFILIHRDFNMGISWYWYLYTVGFIMYYAINIWWMLNGVLEGNCCLLCIYYIFIPMMTNVLILLLFVHNSSKRDKNVHYHHIFIMIARH